MSARTALAARSATRGSVGLLALSAIALGCAPLIATQVYAQGVSVTTMLAIRFSIPALAFWAIVAARRAPLPDRTTIVRGLLQGALFYATQALLFFTAIERVDASVATVLFYLYPALVFVVAVPLGRDRFSRLRFAAVPVSIVGVALVAAGAGIGSVDVLGAAMAAGSALAYVGFTLHGDAVAQRADPFVLVALLATGAVGTFVGFGLATGELHGPIPTAGWLWIVAVGCTTIVAYFAFFKAIRSAGPSLASILAMLEPVFVLGVAGLLLGERLAPVQLVGAVLVVASVLAVNAVELKRAT